MPFVIVIVNSRFLGHVYKSEVAGTSLGPIHWRLTRTKSIGSGQDLESQAGRQSAGYGGWCLELRRGGSYPHLPMSLTLTPSRAPPLERDVLYGLPLNSFLNAMEQGCKGHLVSRSKHKRVRVDPGE